MNGKNTFKTSAAEKNGWTTNALLLQKKTMILVKIFNRHARGWRCGSSFVVSVILRYVIVSTVLPSSLIRNIILTSTEN